MPAEDFRQGQPSQVRRQTIPMSMKNDQTISYCHILIVILACSAVYFHTLFFGITNYDDDVLIANNLPFLQHLPNLLHVFTTDAFYLQKSIDLYRPIQSATFILDAQWGMNPVFAAHFTNLLLHIATCLTVLHLLKKLEFREKFAVLGALIYAVHYLFMSAVAWLPARGDLLLALFSFFTLLTFITVIENGGWKNYLVHGACFTLAVFSKETAVVLPVMLALYLWAYRKGHLLARRHLGLPVFYLMVHLTYFKLKSSAVVLYEGDTGLAALIKNLRTLPETVAKFHLPLNISTLPAYQLHATVAGIAIILLLAALIFFCRHRFDRRLFFYGGWLLLFMIPGMFYYPAFYVFTYEHVDHRAYVTCFGLLLVALRCGQQFELDRTRYFYPISVLLLIYLGSCTIYFSNSYRNPAGFALRAINTNPKSALGYSIYGEQLYLQGRDDEALENLNKSIGIFSKWTPALHTRALIHHRRGENRKALADLDTIVAFDPVYATDAYILRARVKADLHDFDGAAADYQAALRIDSNTEDAAKGLRALQMEKINRFPARAALARQLNLEGIAAGERGDFRQAEEFFRRALVADPAFDGVHDNLGRALLEQSRLDEACKTWKIAAELGSSMAKEQLRGYCRP